MTELCANRAKAYTYLLDDGGEHKKVCNKKRDYV